MMLRLRGGIGVVISTSVSIEKIAEVVNILDNYTYH